MRSCVVLILLIVISGCQQTPLRKVTKAPGTKTQLRVSPVQPVVDIPVDQRQRNPDGSCVHCSWVTLLNNEQLYAMADAWFAKYRGGENVSGLRKKADKEGLRYADTTTGDVAFVDWAIRTRRGAIVNDRPGHVRTLVGLDPAGTPNAKAYVLDNNGPPEKLQVYGRDEWIRMWQRQGGWAATPLYDPPPVVTYR